MRPLRWLLALALAAGLVGPAAAENKKLLLVTDSGGFIHDSVGLAEQVLKEIGPKHGFDVTCYRFTRDPNQKVQEARTEAKRPSWPSTPSGSARRPASRSSRRTAGG